MLDGPVGPTAHLAPAAMRIARRRTVRRWAGLGGVGVLVVAVAVGAQTLAPNTDALTDGLASGNDGAQSTVDSRETARLLGAGGGDLFAEYVSLANDCLRKAGVDAPPAPAASEAAAGPSSLWLAPSGGSYGFAQRSQDATTGAPSDPERYIEVLYGQPREEITIGIEGGGSVTMPTGGCHGEATEALYGVQVEQYERIYQQVRPLAEQAVEEAKRDRRVEGAAVRWSACLATAGWEARTPDGLDNALAPWMAAAEAGGPRHDALVSRESALYEADVQCRDQSGLQAAFDEAFAEHGARVAAEHEDVLLSYRRMLAHAEQVAAGR